MKSLQTIEQEINKRIEAVETEKSNLMTQIEDYNKQIADYQAKQEQALLDGDEEVYTESVQKIEALGRIKDIKEQMLESKKSQPQITREDYEQYKRDIDECFQQAEAEATAVYIELATQMKNKSDELLNLHSNINSMYKKLQHVLYKDCDRMKDRRGNPIGQELRVKGNGAVNALAEPSRKFFYKDNGGTGTAKINQPSKVQERFESIVRVPH